MAQKETPRRDAEARGLDEVKRLLEELEGSLANEDQKREPPRKSLSSLESAKRPPVVEPPKSARTKSSAVATTADQSPSVEARPLAIDPPSVATTKTSPEALANSAIAVEKAPAVEKMGPVTIASGDAGRDAGKKDGKGAQAELVAASGKPPAPQRKRRRSALMLWFVSVVMTAALGSAVVLDQREALLHNLITGAAPTWMDRNSPTHNPFTARAPSVPTRAQQIASPLHADPEPLVHILGSSTSTQAIALPETAETREPTPLPPTQEPDPRFAHYPASTGPPASPPPHRADIEVEATIEITAGQSRAVPIAIDAITLGQPGAYVVVSGLPGGYVLNSGTPDERGDWRIAAGQVRGLALTGPSQDSGLHELSVRLQSATSEILAAKTVVLLVSPPPASPSMPKASQHLETQAAQMLAEGIRHLSAGHVPAARIRLLKAAESGSAEAAQLLGDSYDPTKLLAFGVRGLVGDAEQAKYWYKRAEELGRASDTKRSLASGIKK